MYAAAGTVVLWYRFPAPFFYMADDERTIGRPIRDKVPAPPPPPPLLYGFWGPLSLTVPRVAPGSTGNTANCYVLGGAPGPRGGVSHESPSGYENLPRKTLKTPMKKRLIGHQPCTLECSKAD